MEIKYVVLEIVLWKMFVLQNVFWINVISAYVN